MGLIARNPVLTNDDKIPMVSQQTDPESPNSINTCLANLSCLEIKINCKVKLICFGLSLFFRNIAKVNILVFCLQNTTRIDNISTI